MLNSNKKLSILCILEILKEYSDENHPLTQTDIVKKLFSTYGMAAERKSIGMTIDSLIDFGFDIVKNEGGGCYLASREFEPSEIAFLIDAVFSSKNIPAKYAKDLAEKLSKFGSKYKQKRYHRYIYKADEISRTNNKDLFLNIEIINEAIDNNKQIEFVYNVFNDKKELKSRGNNPYVINPYFMLNNNGKYYLVCNREGYPNLSNYKLDLITNIKIKEQTISPATKLKEFEKGLDIAKYANENIYPFGRNVISAVIKLDHESVVNNVIDWFGEKTKIYTKQNETFAEVTSVELAIIYWAMQYGENVEIIEPLETREKIKEIVEKMKERYIKNR